MHFAYFYVVMGVLLILKINHIYAVGQLYTSEANVTYYIDFERKYTWFDSQLACSSMNMTLVEISTSSKSKDLDALIKIVEEQNSNAYNDFLWTGGIRTRLPEQQFVWFSTGEKFTYSNWYGNNPVLSDNNYFCVELVMHENRKWNDQSCITKGGFVCEYSKEKINQQELHKNLLQVQHNLQQEVGKLKEQINQELQKQNNLKQQFEEQKLRHHEELEELKNNNLQQELTKKHEYHEQLEKLKKQYLETQEEQLKTITQMEARNNETLENELVKHKQLQQQMQEHLDEKEQLNKQLQVLKEQKSKLEENLEMEKTKHVNLQQELKNQQEQPQEIRERLEETMLEETTMQHQIKEQLEKHMKNYTKDLKKIYIQRNTNSPVVVYSPYSMVFNYYKPNP